MSYPYIAYGLAGLLRDLRWAHLKGPTAANPLELAVAKAQFELCGSVVLSMTGLAFMASTQRLGCRIRGAMLRQQ